MRAGPEAHGVELYGGYKRRKAVLEGGWERDGSLLEVNRVIKERAKGLQEVEAHRCIFDGEERLALERCVDAFKRQHVGVHFRLQQVLVVLISLITT